MNTRSGSISEAADQSAAAANQFTHAAKRAGRNALNSASEAVDDARDQAAPLLQRAQQQASALKERGLDLAHDQAQKIRAEAQRVSDSAISYVKKEPVKVALLVMAASAIFIAVNRAIRRSRWG